jgi:hypothetical protein
MNNKSSYRLPTTEGESVDKTTVLTIEESNMAVLSCQKRVITFESQEGFRSVVKDFENRQIS